MMINPRFNKSIFVIILFLIMSVFLTHDAQEATCDDTYIKRVSITSDGTQGNESSNDASISGDGRYVAFVSTASNLVLDDTNNSSDIFVHDRQTDETSRVSIASDGTQANDNSTGPSISSDGRFVAYDSQASNLVLGDTNNRTDVFVHDRQTGETSRVSITSDGTQGNNWSSFPSISSDGRFVAFTSVATNLVLGDTNNTGDVFVHDRQTGETSRVSIASNSMQGNDNSGSSSISGDGRFVAFISEATNLVWNDTSDGYGPNIFVHDRQTGETSRVSIASDGTQANSNFSYNPSISSDGRFVAYDSQASNLVLGDTNNRTDVFVHDRQTGETSRVSIASDGTQGNEFSSDPSISGDGRYVAFKSYADTLVSNDTNDEPDMFIHDRQTGETSRISIAYDGSQANGDSFGHEISEDGRYIAFSSSASTLVCNDTNEERDIFVVDTGFTSPDLTYTDVCINNVYLEDILSIRMLGEQPDPIIEVTNNRNYWISLGISRMTGVIIAPDLENIDDYDPEDLERMSSLIPPKGTRYLKFHSDELGKSVTITVGFNAEHPRLPIAITLVEKTLQAIEFATGQDTSLIVDFIADIPPNQLLTLIDAAYALDHFSSAIDAISENDQQRFFQEINNAKQAGEITVIANIVKDIAWNSGQLFIVDRIDSLINVLSQRSLNIVGRGMIVWDNLNLYFQQLALPQSGFATLTASGSIVASQVSYDNQYVVFLDGIRSSSSIEEPSVEDRFCQIRAGLREIGIENFVYFSYGATSAENRCIGWGMSSCNLDGIVDYFLLNRTPIYTIANTKLPLLDQRIALNWMLGQIVEQDPDARIHLVGYSLGGVVAGHWASARIGSAERIISHVDNVITIESPVGGNNLHYGFFEDCSNFINCPLYQGIFDYLFGEAILEDLNANGPLIQEISESIRNGDFPYTSIQSSTDYLVNGISLPISRSIGRDEILIGYGSQLLGSRHQRYPETPGELSHFTLGLAEEPLPLSNPLNVQRFLMVRHTAPLFYEQTTQWIQDIIASTMPLQLPEDTIVPQSSLPLGQQVLIYRDDTAHIWLRSIPGTDDSNSARVPSATMASIVSSDPATASGQTWYEVETVPDRSIGWVESTQLRLLPTDDNATIQSVCPGAGGYYFEMGDRITVPYGDGPTNIYSRPNSQPLVGQLHEGELATVSGGPECREGRTGYLLSWYVTTDMGIQGWMGGGYPDSQVPWIVPLMPLEPTSSHGNQSELVLNTSPQVIEQAQFREESGIHVGIYCQSKGYIDARYEGGDAYSWECYDQTRSMPIDFQQACQEVYGNEKPYATLENATYQFGWRCSATEGYVAPQYSPTQVVIPNNTGSDVTHCSGSLPSRLRVGTDARQILLSDPVRVQNEPGGGTTLFFAYPGDVVTVVGGPECHNIGTNPATWWQVRGVNDWVGWVAEGVDGQYYLEPMQQ